MSYDYNALVSSINQARIKAAAAAATENDSKAHCLEYLQQAMEGFESLSTHCPMTPLLWIHYANTAREFLLASDAINNTDTESINGTDRNAADAANKIRLETLELGLLEFPGSALLHVYRNSLMNTNTTADTTTDTDTTATEASAEAVQALTTAIAAVGHGSHRHEDAWVAQLYNWMAARQLQQQQQQQQQPPEQAAVDNLFVQRAAVPMREANDAIVAEYQSILTTMMTTTASNQDCRAAVLQRIEDARRLSARVWSPYERYEQAIDEAMHQEGIPLGRHVLPLDTMEQWTELLCQRQQTTAHFGMGVGGAHTARAFVQYAVALSSHGFKANRRKLQEDEDPEQFVMEQSLSSVALAVFERGVAECPTVESIWLSYIRCLQDQIYHHDHHQSNSQQAESNNNNNNNNAATAALARRLESVARRAVRNCPYSVALVQQELQSHFVLAQFQLQVLDPDNLIQAVKTALDRKFITGGDDTCWELYATAIRTVKRRILHLQCPGTKKASVVYDEPLALNTKEKPVALDDSQEEEVQDLVQDLPEMMEHIETKFRDNSAVRALLWKERALTEQYMLEPMRKHSASRGTGATQQETVSHVLIAWEKAMKVHNPPHPMVYLQYIRQYCITSQLKEPAAWYLRKVRFLFQRAIQSVGPSKTTDNREYITALANLGNEWIEMERAVGSDRSMGKAQQVIQRKLKKAGANAVPDTTPAAASQASTEQTKEDSKRKVQEDQETSRPAKKQKVREEKEPMDAAVDEEAKITAEVEPDKNSKPGFKAHPFTVRVSNLDPATEDMDIVDTFRPKCGAIVHAKIMRDKHHHHEKGHSKGWALIQFEEREAVEKAMELNEEIGIRGKVVKVERSHMSAVSLVPPGMHRVKPQGEGKSSKRNQKRREQKDHSSDTKHSEKGGRPESNVQEKDAATEKKTESVLAFRPRGIGRAGRQKVKLVLDNKSLKKVDK